MTSCASASRAPEKIRTSSVPRWPPRGMMPVTVGEAQKANEPQRHREHREKKHRENQLWCRILLSSFFLCVSSLCVLCASVVRFLLCQQLFAQFTFVHDDDRPVARGEQLLVRVNAELVVDRVRQVFDCERV